MTCGGGERERERERKTERERERETFRYANAWGSPVPVAVGSVKSGLWMGFSRFNPRACVGRRWLLAQIYATARLAQSAERKALNLVVVGSSPMVGEWLLALLSTLPSLH